ncbi:MAG: hypothetical protein NT151_10795 [Acidobacteria bacterium]|nr:hypothetical protein [Acidobacteriota bacterium]
MRFARRTVLWTGVCLALGILFSPVLRSIERGKHESPPIPALTAFTDDVVGFSLKRPAGWRLRYTTGVIAVLKDDQAREGVLIYPVKPKPGFTLQAFLTSYLTVLKASPTSAARIEFADLLSDRLGATARVSGVVSGTPISGLATAVAQAPDYVLTVIWAPAAEFAAKQNGLREIAGSYRRVPGVALVKLSGTYFETMAPKGWRILEESSNSVSFVNATGDAGVMSAYADFGGDPSPMTVPRLFEAATKPCSPGQQPCWSVAKTYNRLAFVDAPDFKDALGRIWKARAEEFEATLVDAAGSRVHGVLTGMVMNGRHVTGLYGWFIATATRSARPDRWESQAAATAIVQENLKILRASELITGRILPRNNPYDSSTIMGSSAYKNNVDAELSAKRQESIMGYEPYRTPTGERIDVPLNSIPGGSHPLYYHPSSGLLWNSTLDPPPQGYVLLKK